MIDRAFELQPELASHDPEHIAQAQNRDAHRTVCTTNTFSHLMGQFPNKLARRDIKRHRESLSTSYSPGPFPANFDYWEGP
jgi:hypothetical protein